MVTAAMGAVSGTRCVGCIPRLRRVAGRCKRMHPYIASQHMYKNSNVKSNMSICVFENMSSYVRTNV